MATLNALPSADTFVSQSFPTTNVHNFASLVIGDDADDGYGMCRVWLKFPLSGIPAGSTINTAKIQILDFFPHEDSYGMGIGDIARCTDNSWTETGITWNSAPNASVGSVITSLSLSLINNGTTIEFTGLASAISSALTDGQVSFRIKIQDEASQGANSYNYWQDGDYAGATTPKLIVDYTVPAASTGNFFLMFP